MTLNSFPIPGIFCGRAGLHGPREAPDDFPSARAWLERVRISAIDLVRREATADTASAQAALRAANIMPGKSGPAASGTSTMSGTTGRDQAMTSPSDATQSMGFDYDAPAELFSVVRSRKSAPARYRRFETAAEAIRFAVEELPPPVLVGTYLEVQEERFDGAAIRALYDHADYPLRRLTDMPDE